MLLKYIHAFKDIIYPPLCFACERKIQEGYLCPECQDKVEYLFPPLCRLCSRPLSYKNSYLCSGCIGKKSPFKRVISITAYKEPMTKLLHLFKYKNYDYLGRFLSHLMIQHIERIGLDLSCYQAIIPVPLHPFRRKERGYNQTELLAKQIANHFQIPLRNDIIYQKKDKTSQTKLKKEQREKAMQGVFIAKESLKGKNIVLIDDILTTGSTLKECALTLKKRNTKDIIAITLSKTLS
ncbi:MAG: ComF family protein [Candidatus Omnitrophota bacterium]|nr:MAG: ComF family protein [Candidatus Omnitrophota bacterium]